MKEYCLSCKNRPQVCKDKGRDIEEYNSFNILDLDLFDQSGWVIWDLLNELDNCLMKYGEILPLFEDDEVRPELMRVVRDWISKNNNLKGEKYE